MDRPADAGAAVFPGIESALEERHAVPALGQKYRQERAGETGADERDLRGIAGCSHSGASRLAARGGARR